VGLSCFKNELENFINPYFLNLDKNILKQAQYISKCLDTVLIKYLNNNEIINYFLNNNNYTQIDKKIINFYLKKNYINNRLYRIDFLLDKNKEIKICEINCRYLENSSLILLRYKKISKKIYLDSMQLNHLLNKKNLLLFDTKPSNFLKELNHTYKNEIDNILNIENHSLSSFDNILLEASPINIIPKLNFLSDKHIQNKLLNHPLFITLIHNKFLLYILRNKVFINKITNSTERDILLKHIIPTFSSNHIPKDTEYLFKPCFSGKGKSVQRYKKDTSIKEKYIIQKIITPYKFNELLLYNNYVGTFLVFNGRLVCIGLFRTGNELVVNFNNNPMLLPQINLQS